jgi:hypothetical protein
MRSHDDGNWVAAICSCNNTCLSYKESFACFSHKCERSMAAVEVPIHGQSDSSFWYIKLE